MNKKIITMAFFFLLISNAIAETTYTPTSRTECDKKGKCTLTLYSGIRQVYENSQWKLIENADSLIDYYDMVYLENDKTHQIKVKDFNLSYIELELSYDKENIGEYEYEMEENKMKTKFKITEEVCWVLLEQYNCEKIEKEYEIEIEENEKLSKKIFTNPLGKEFKIGQNSTTIVLQDENTENLEDVFIYASASTNYGDATNIAIGFFSTNQYKSGIKFSLEQIPSQVTILDANLALFVYLEDLEAGELITVKNLDDQNWNEHIITGANPWNAELIIDELDSEEVAVNTWTSLDVTTWGDEVYRSKDENLSFFLTCTGCDSGSSDRLFAYSKEYQVDSAKKPMLVITYTPVLLEIRSNNNASTVGANPTSVDFSPLDNNNYAILVTMSDSTSDTEYTSPYLNATTTSFQIYTLDDGGASEPLTPIYWAAIPVHEYDLNEDIAIKCGFESDNPTSKYIEFDTPFDNNRYAMICNAEYDAVFGTICNSNFETKTAAGVDINVWNDAGEPFTPNSFSWCAFSMGEYTIDGLDFKVGRTPVVWESVSTTYFETSFDDTNYVILTSHSDDYDYLDAGNCAVSNLQTGSFDWQCEDDGGRSGGDGEYFEWVAFPAGDYTLSQVIGEGEVPVESSCNPPDTGTWNIINGDNCTINDVNGLVSGHINIVDGTLTLTSTAVFSLDSGYSLIIEETPGNWFNIENGGQLITKE